MVNKRLFLSAMTRAGYNQVSLSTKLGMSENSLSEKINNKRFFNTWEIDLACNAMGIIDIIEKAEIFLSNPSQNRDNVGLETNSISK